MLLGWFGPAVVAVPPGVTHLGIHSKARAPWRVEVVDPEKLSKLGLPASDKRGSVLTHRLGLTQVVIRSADRATVDFYEPCDCAADCRQDSHQEPKRLAVAYKKGKTEFELPAEQGIVHISTGEPWSLEPKRVR